MLTWSCLQMQFNTLLRKHLNCKKSWWLVYFKLALYYSFIDTRQHIIHCQKKNEKEEKIDDPCLSFRNRVKKYAQTCQSMRQSLTHYCITCIIIDSTPSFIPLFNPYIFRKFDKFLPHSPPPLSFYFLSLKHNIQCSKILCARVCVW